MGWDDDVEEQSWKLCRTGTPPARQCIRVDAFASSVGVGEVAARVCSCHRGRGRRRGGRARGGERRGAGPPSYDDARERERKLPRRDAVTRLYRLSFSPRAAHRADDAPLFHPPPQPPPQGRFHHNQPASARSTAEILGGMGWNEFFFFLLLLSQWETRSGRLSPSAADRRAPILSPPMRNPPPNGGWPAYVTNVHMERMMATMARSTKAVRMMGERRDAGTHRTNERVRSPLFHPTLSFDGPGGPFFVSCTPNKTERGPYSALHTQKIQRREYTRNTHTLPPPPPSPPTFGVMEGVSQK
jgi:hypothetical protein